ncbi:MAG: asparaginase, partial [Bacteroidales bacterium]|nr:asparaginase [Bacteroidales bacterium]
QLPIGVPRTDGKENLISSIEIASSMDAEGHAIVPEVVIYFNSKLMRGNRTTKTSSENFDAFSSPNYPLLGEAGINIRFFPEYIRKPLSWVAPLRINTTLDTRVSILKLHPGMTPDVLKHLLCGKETRAVIIETYGSGNAPTKPWFLDIIREAVAMGKIIVNVTQCLEGAVNMSLYEGGKAMHDAGVTSGYDGTTESTLAKLFFLLGLSKDNEAVRTRMEASLKGEISK